VRSAFAAVHGARASVAALCTCLLLCQVACTNSEIVNALNDASIALDVLATAAATVATPLPPVLQADLANYMGVAAQALSTAATDMASGSLTPAEIAQIVATLVKDVAPSLPANAPAWLATDLTAAANDVAAFIAQIDKSAPMAAPLVKGNRSVKLAISSSAQAKILARLAHVGEVARGMRR
jgi:hypothetical protein